MVATLRQWIESYRSRVTWVSNSLVTYHAWKAFPILGGLFFLTLHIMVVGPLVCYPPPKSHHLKKSVGIEKDQAKIVLLKQRSNKVRLLLFVDAQ